MTAPTREFPPLRVAHLYPSLLNVAGDGGNLRAIEQRCSWRGIPVETAAVELRQVPEFTDFDIVLFHGGQDVEMSVVAADLATKAESLREAADSGVIMFAVCAGLQLLGHRYIPPAGPAMRGTGILDLETRGGGERFMQHAAARVTLDGESETVVGFENHSGVTELGPGVRPFGQIIAGAGNNGRDHTEGAVRGNVMATYFHGPVLPKNPWLTDYLIRTALQRRSGDSVVLPPLDDAVERANRKVALEKAMQNRGRRTALEPARLLRSRRSERIVTPGMRSPTEPSVSPLAMTPESFSRAATMAADIATARLARMRQKPVYESMPEAASRRLLALELPEQGMSAEMILRFFADHVMPYDYGNQSPTFAAWVNPAAAPIGVLLDFLTSAMNPTAANGNHAATYVEQCVLRWLRDIVGFPDTTEGILVDGGSLANLHCLAAALHRACTDDGWDLRNEGLHGYPKRLVVYTSPEVHSCVHKSTRLLGLGAPHQVEMDSHLHIDVSSVARAVRADRAAGLRPFCVVASAGTVNTGVVDPLGELADLCAEEGLWLHVDGAYGGFGLLDPSVAPLYAGLERAHSLAMDPHKWLAVPNTCSAALVSDGAALRGAFGFEASYLRFEATDGFGAGKRFDALGIYQTRRFLAAKLLGVLFQLGRSGLREHIARHISLRRKLEALIDAEPALERMSDSDLTIACFRYAPERLRSDDARLDEVNKEIVERLQRGGRVFLSGTVVGGRNVLRSCALHYALDEDDLRTIVDEVLSVGAEVLMVSG